LKTGVSIAGESSFKVAGQIGIGTWDTAAEFKDVRVERNGQVLYASDFAQGTEGWQADGRGRRGGGGRWSVQDGAYRQNQRGRGTAYTGPEDWSDYTLTLKARKLSGGEGFLIVFGRRGTDMFWWNLGGWGNTQHAIEHSVQGGQTPVGAPAPGRIETERWYDIKIELSGNRIRCYLDGKLTNEGSAEAARSFFASAGREDATGDLVIKAINLAAEPAVGTLKLEGVTPLASPATVTMLKSDALTDNNSLDEPTRVAPAVSQLEGAGKQFTHEFAPYSLTILRLKTQ
jgi:alpha-L-arabinofuranosidase